MEIILRAHHVLCIQGFRGKGYSAEFVANFAYIVERLNTHKDTQIELIAGPDDICRCCPYLGEGGCKRSRNEPEKFSQQIDTQVFQRLGLGPGTRLSWTEVLEQIKARIESKDLVSICWGCPWIFYNYCLIGLRNLKDSP